MAADTGFLSEARSTLKDLFRAAVKAVSPNELIKRRVQYRNNVLYVHNTKYPLQENVYLVGFGKAVMGMAIELERMLGDSLKKGIVSVPENSMDTIWKSEDMSSFPKLHNSVIEYREGSINNQPDDRSLETTHRIIDLVEQLTTTDTLIVLVSGGGSALLYMPRPVLDHMDKLELCKKLQNAGASITELNIVRRKLSLVKGGGLARMAYPASVISLILSDIINDPIDLIASGPTVYSAKAPEEVVAILKKYDLYHTLDGDLKKVLMSKESFNDAPLLNPAKKFKHVTNIIIGNNTVAIEAAWQEAMRKKLTPIILKNDVQGSVDNVSLGYVHIVYLVMLALMDKLTLKDFYDKASNNVSPLDLSKVNELYHYFINMTGDIVLIGGGEPTVVVKGQGKGGRNLELAAHFSQNLYSMFAARTTFANYEVMMLSAGTDGQDGPTDATGAFGYPAIVPITIDLHRRVNNMVKEKFTTRPEEAMKYGKKISTNEETQSIPCEQLKKTFSVGTQKKDLDGVTARSVQADVVDIDFLALTLMEAERMLLKNTLEDNDTYNFYSRFKKGTDLLKTGLTGTNVMDLHFIYIRKKQCKSAIRDKVTECEHIFDVHDLRIDATTLKKYKITHTSFETDKDEDLTTEEKKPPLDIKIVDENLTGSCCHKKRDS